MKPFKGFCIVIGSAVLGNLIAWFAPSWMIAMMLSSMLTAILAWIFW